jgi:hypothetical protein
VHQDQRAQLYRLHGVKAIKPVHSFLSANQNKLDRLSLTSFFRLV